MLRSLGLFALAVCPVAAFAQPPTHRVELTDHQTIQVGIGYEIRTVNFAVTRWMAFLPEPPELPSQTKLKTAAEPAGKVIAEKSPLARKVRMFDLPVANPL